MKDKLRELAERWIADANAFSTINPFDVVAAKFLREHATELLTILDASQDYVCVPVDPTDGMVDAWVAAEIPPIIGNDEAVNRAVCTADWKAMLAASKETNRE